MQAPVLNPTTDALFNVAIAWIFMFLPLLLLDQRGRHLPKVALWGAAMFLTNVFLTPYMALRARNPVEPVITSPKKGVLARIFGVVGFAVGTGAIAWGLFARPEFGGWTTRWSYFLGELTTSRVAIAFCVDLVLFAIWQMILMGAIEPIGSPKRWLRFIPLWGLAIWLIL
ncbi:MAG: hypothetical protein F6K09_08020 [Merismopedia sp. SIO2A8]|nr:hypothetical protein [Merismopedia sp. SIO2A8]